MVRRRQVGRFRIYDEKAADLRSRTNTLGAPHRQVVDAKLEVRSLLVRQIVDIGCEVVIGPIENVKAAFGEGLGTKSMEIHAADAREKRFGFGNRNFSPSAVAKERRRKEVAERTGRMNASDGATAADFGLVEHLKRIRCRENRRYRFGELRRAKIEERRRRCGKLFARQERTSRLLRAFAGRIRSGEERCRNGFGRNCRGQRFRNRLFA